MADQASLDRLSERGRTDGYGSLTDTAKVWLNIRSFIDSVENGGLISYFYNPSADTFTDCAAALQTLEARAVYEQVMRLAACFGSSVPTNIEQRNDVIDSWSDDGYEDELIQEIDDILMPLMPELEQRLAHFLSARGIS